MNTNLEFKVVRHSELNDELIKDIALFKNQTWIYTIESQIQFLKENLGPNDFHVFIQLNNEIVSYLSVINVDVYLNGIIKTLLGVGSVCTSPQNRKKGYANRLLDYTEKIILKENSSILLCREHLSYFYIKLNWYILERNLLFKEKKINIMAKNLSPNVKIKLTRLF